MRVRGGGEGVTGGEWRLRVENLGSVRGVAATQEGGRAKEG